MPDSRQQAEVHQEKSTTTARCVRQRAQAHFLGSGGALPSVAALACAASAGRSRTGERLRQPAARGAIEKDTETGLSRLAGEEAT